MTHGMFTEAQDKLNQEMLNNPEVFDTSNNCFKLAARGIAKELKLSSHTTVVRQLKKLKDLYIAKTIKDSSGNTKLMVDPDYYYRGKPSDKNLLIAAFTMESFNKALEFDLLQREIGYSLDPVTGQWLGTYDYTTPRAHIASLFSEQYITEELIHEKFLEIKNK